MDIFTKAWLLLHIARWRLTWNKRDTGYRPAELKNPKFVSARDAVRLIQDGSVVMSSGMAANSRCSIFFWALKELFQATQHPRNLTWVAVGAQGSRGRSPGSLEELAIPGLITRYVGGHLETIKALLKLAEAGQLELQTMPQGDITFSLEAQARGEDSVLSETGLGTFLDPRVGSGTQVVPGKGENLVSVEGDRLRYRLPKIGVAMFVAPYADPEGNIYMENAATYTESRESALAARHNGGKVLVAVAEIKEKDPAKIFLPADQVDVIVVNPRVEQTGSVAQRRYWPMFTVGGKVDAQKWVALLKWANMVVKITPVRDQTEDAMARMAASIFTRIAAPGAQVNIGVGLPEEVCRLVLEGGLFKDVIFATETGVYGGMPTPGVFFGAAVNPTRMMSSAEIFHLWEKRLDVTILGLLQADSHGNVNVSKRGEGPINYVGPGGLPNLVNSAKAIIFIGSWMAHAEFAIEDGQLKIKKPGLHKFGKTVDQITFSGDRALAQGKQVYYVTHVGAFRLTPRGMELYQVMPGVDIQRDILDACPMKVVLPEGKPVPVVDPAIVTGGGFRLEWQKPA
jgi:propionate CoA-transferase